MKQHPIVSIIIPTYNSGEYILETLESIFRQTRTDYEVIVIDDGSTDGTEDILADYKTKIRYFKQTNMGVSTARNNGLDKANGEWILFLDADDTIVPEKLEKQLALGDSADDNIGIIHSGWWEIDDNRQILKCVEPYQTLSDMSLKTWLQWKPVFPGAMIFRKKWVEKVGGFDPSMTHAEDVDLVLRVVHAGAKTIWLKEPTVYYRQHQKNASNQIIKQIDHSLYLLDKFYNLPLSKDLKQGEALNRYYTIQWWCFQLLKNDLSIEAHKYLQLIQSYVDMPPIYHLFQWEYTVKRLDNNHSITQQHIIDSFASADGQVMLSDGSGIDANIVLSRQYQTDSKPLSSKALVELYHYDIFINAVNMTFKDMKTITAQTNSTGLLSAWLTRNLMALPAGSFIFLKVTARSIYRIILHSFNRKVLFTYVFVIRSFMRYALIRRRYVNKREVTS